jgi:hypothetical protein
VVETAVVVVMVNVMEVTTVVAVASVVEDAVNVSVSVAE